MRIGIVTYWKTYDNYGTVLQYYALQTYLQKMGHEPYLIRDDFRGAVKSEVSRLLRRGELFLLLKKGIRRIWGKKINDKRHFEDFRNKYFYFSDHVYHSYQQIYQTPPLADVYVVGSDQPWNFYGQDLARIKNRMYYYFLDFGSKDIKRISCAVSFGFPKIDPVHRETMQKLLKKFNFVSVREKFGVDLCKSLGYDDAVLQRDPTFFLSKSDYQRLQQNEIEDTRPFILLYLLDNTTDFSIYKLKTWGRQNNLAVKYVRGNSWMKKKTFYRSIYATVPQFLELINKATYIFTNSYHGTIFSIIYGKKFCYINQSGNFAGQNTRLIELLNYLNLQERQLKDDFNVVKQKIDYERIKNILEDNLNNSEFIKYIKACSIKS